MPAFTAHKAYTSGSASASVKLKATYTVTETATTVTVAITKREPDYDGTTGSGQNLALAKDIRMQALHNGIAYTIACGGTTLYSGNVTLISGNIAYSSSGSGSVTFTKGTSATTKTLSMSLGGTAANNQTITIPALASYPVTYNANGGTGTTAAQTKYYGQSLTLRSNGFTRLDHTFLGWSGSPTATTPTYQAGGSYTANAAATLYAVWKRIYQVPQFTVTNVYRADVNGNPADEGEYAVAIVSWSIFNTSGNSVSTFTATCNGHSASASPSGMSGTQTFLINAGLGTGSYDLTVTLADTKGANRSPVGKTEKTVSVPAAFYPIDILAGGHGIAFGAPATRENVMEIGFEDMEMDVNTSAASGLDHDLYAAISGLSWTSIISSGLMSVKKLFTTILGCCYISGSGGGWSWRKYADGTIDMWRTYSGSLTDYGNAGGWYFYQGVFYFPSDTIIGTDYSVHTVWKVGTSISVAAWCAKGSGSFTTYGARIGSGGTNACIIDMYVHGRWK